jgi:hypothetical protein
MRYTYLPLLHRCHAIYFPECGTHIYQYSTNVTKFNTQVCGTHIYHYSTCVMQFNVPVCGTHIYHYATKFPFLVFNLCPTGQNQNECHLGTFSSNVSIPTAYYSDGQRRQGRSETVMLEVKQTRSHNNCFTVRNSLLWTEINFWCTMKHRVTAGHRPLDMQLGIKRNPRIQETYC